MSSIYIKPFIDMYGSSQYKLLNLGQANHMNVMMTRVELEDLIKQAEGAMLEVDKYIIEHPKVES